MSGHNKWSQIKHKKAKEDSKRGLAFTKLIKEITVVARNGGGDPDHNPKLRLLLEKAREINMPIDNSQRAIKRGTGELAGVAYEECTYEGYAPGGVAVLIDALTDNKNRTVAELRRVFSRHGGSLADAGTVSWMFQKLGVVRAVDPKNRSEDELLELLLEYEPDDLKKENGTVAVYCAPKSLLQIKQQLEELGMKIETVALESVAKTTIDLSDEDSEKVLTLLSTLQDHDDVQNVYTTLA
jgi:YebC/PmpR family DNA-binding regulatory protein